MNKKYTLLLSMIAVVFVIYLLPLQAQRGDDDRPPKWTLTPSATASVTATLPATATPTITNTATPLPSATASPLPTETATIKPSETSIPTASATEAPIRATASHTASPATATDVPVRATATEEPSPEITVTTSPTLAPSATSVIRSTAIPSVAPSLAVMTLVPTATPTLPANLSWVYVVGDTFERDDNNPYQLEGTWQDTQVSRGSAIQPSSNTTLRYTEHQLFDLALLADIYLAQGNLHFHFRQSLEGAYRLQVSADGSLNLYWNQTELTNIQLSSPLSGAWHNIRIQVVDYSIQVYVDETLIMSYLDSNHVPAGTLSIYADATSALRLDNVEIWIPENLERNQAIFSQIEAEAPRPVEVRPTRAAEPVRPTPVPSSSERSANNLPETQLASYAGNNGIRMKSPTCDHSISAGDVTGLITAINTANGDGLSTMICLAQGTYTVTTVNVTQDGSNGLPVITGDMTIVGEGTGATLERGSTAPSFRFFRVNSTANFMLENLTIQNGHATGSGYAGYGGAIYNEGILSLLNTTFDDNEAQDEGGAIYNHSNADISITTSTFTNNTVVNDDGGAIDNHGDVTITGSTFQFNESVNDDGGALWNEAGSTMSITNSTLTNNTADNQGGAVMNFGTLSITNSTIDNNTAGQSGGAIYIEQGSLGLITDGSFSNNTATNDDGGAVYTNEDITFNNVDLNGNTAGDKGGAIYAFAADITIENNSELHNNLAAHNGGAIFISNNSASLSISNASFEGNGSGNDGGAIHLENGTHTISNTLFYDNGAIRHGGAIYTDSTLLTVNQDTIFDANEAGNDGGAIYAYGTFNVTDAVFKNNVAADQGGAYRGYASTSSSITDSCIFNNTANNISGVYSARSNFNATNNWWGASDGPDGSGSGSGDEVNWGVSYTPFVTDLTCPSSSQAPVLTVTSANVTYNENDPAVILLTDVIITDGDSSTLDSVTITITNLADGADEILDVTLSGTFTSVYNNGVLTITDSSGTATLTEFADIIETLTYENIADNPDTTTRLIDIVVNDGLSNSNTEQISLSLTATNDAPQLFLDGADATFVEAGTPVAVLNDVTITDVDSTEMSSATITITNITDDADEILDVTLSGTFAKSYLDGELIITDTSGTATIADFEQIIETLTYENTSTTPNTASRDIEIVISDDNSADSLPEIVRVYLNDVAHVPVINLDVADASGVAPNYSTSYTEGTAVIIVGNTANASSVSIADDDSSHLSALSVEIINDYPEDQLSVDVTGTTLITSYNSGLLTISGYATLADYETVLSTLTYDNTADNPDTTARDLEVIAWDGENNSDTRTIEITINQVNTAPTINLDTANIARLTPNTATNFEVGSSAINVNKDVAISDPEDTQLTGATIILSGNDNGADEILSIDVGTTGIVVTTPNATTIELTGSANLSDYADVLETLTYINTAITPILTSDREVNITVTDGNLDSVTVTSTITIVDNFPSDVTCITWDSGTAEGWQSATGGVVWDTTGMYSDGTVTPVQTDYQLQGTGPWELVITSNEAASYSVLSGTNLGTVSTITARADGTYYIEDDVIALEWTPPDSLLFQSICYSSTENIDLAVTHLDTNSVDVDFDSLEVSGVLSANISNLGTEDVTDRFTVLFFDDRNNNQQYDPETDVILAQETQDGLAAGQTLTINANASGTVEFAGDLVYVYVDSSDQIAESTEDNNFFWAQCGLPE